MSRQGPATRTVAHSRPLRWDATPSRMGVDGSCEWGWGAFVSFNSAFFRSLLGGAFSRQRVVGSTLSMWSRRTLKQWPVQSFHHHL